MSRMIALLAAAIAASPAAGQPRPSENAADVRGAAVESADEAEARSVARALSSNPDMAAGLASRLLDSRITQAITASQDKAKAYADLQSWISKNPLDAARLALGFAQDDADGTKTFEDSLFNRIERHFRLNPNRYDGIYGDLHEMAGVSKEIASKKNVNDETRREHLRSFFDGLAGEGAGRRLSGGKDDGGAVSAGLAQGEFYDRLSAANPTGFSPDVLTLQSQLNSSRPPGAPKLIPTGKLDYETLHYPFFGLRRALDMLLAAMRSQRAYLQAKGLGLPLEGKDRARWEEPAGQKSIDIAAGSKDPSPAFTRRKEILDKATTAVEYFEALANRAKNPKWITAAGLKQLSAARLDAVRWLLAASLLEKLHRVESRRGFLTPALAAAISRAAGSEESRARYLDRGRRLEAEIDDAAAEIRSRADQAASGTLPRATESTLLSSRTREAVRRIPDEVGSYVSVAERLASIPPPSSGALGAVDRWSVRLFPRAPHSRALLKREAQRQELLREFERVGAMR